MSGPIVKSSEVEVPCVPPWTDEEREMWKQLLESFAVALLPEEDSSREGVHEKRARQAVKMGAQLADLAVAEFQFRNFEQDARPDPVSHVGRERFEEFQEWLSRTRTGQPKRSILKKGVKR